jgi:hypothetical protein
MAEVVEAATAGPAMAEASGAATLVSVVVTVFLVPDTLDSEEVILK